MTPLLVVTGFLGAGKTTFLRTLLPALGRVGLRARVLLNDFADARIDGATLADLVPDLVALSGTCVCCEDLDEMLALLGGMETRPGDVAIVEANGGTEASELLALLGGAPELDRYAPPLQLTVVDAKRFGDRGWQNEIEREQLLTATHVVIGRRDLVDEARAGEVAGAALAIATRAVLTDAGGLAAAVAKVDGEVRGIGCRARGPEDDHDHIGCPAPGPQDDHDHASHATHFAAHVAPLAAPVDEATFLRFLRELPPEILRAKGIVLLRDPHGGPPLKRSFQKVGDEAEISPCELADPDAQSPRAIFVGPHLPLDLITARLGEIA